MPTIHDIIATETFRQRVADTLISSQIDQSGTAYDSRDGLIKGSVTAFAVQTGPTFGTPDGEDPDWTIPFTGTGDTTVDYKTSDSEYGSDDVAGPFEGFARVTMPSDQLASASADDVAEEVQFTIEIESVTRDAIEPEVLFDDSAIDERA
ncbi:hypothetical protein [Verrucomicrobium sp. BvORR106]|uniref:hypothetical protein n=1 Tax=Verrucomicrobium sp. BvORR106 TaxID=1403819 RepID=UPI000570DBC4|nr:hypothetical protein [Verrucomicrobium sp. BvORR106]